MQISWRRAKAKDLHGASHIFRTMGRPGWLGHGEGHVVGAEVRELTGLQIMSGHQATTRTLAFDLSGGKVIEGC